jgi:hypothetical protein
VTDLSTHSAADDRSGPAVQVPSSVRSEAFNSYPVGRAGATWSSSGGTTAPKADDSATSRSAAYGAISRSVVSAGSVASSAPA